MRRPSVWKDFATISLLFIILTVVIVYTRDQLLALRHSPRLLNHRCRLALSHFDLHRRGCRAGANLRLRAATARGLTSQRTTTSIRRQQCALRHGYKNNERLTSCQDSTGRDQWRSQDFAKGGDIKGDWVQTLCISQHGPGAEPRRGSRAKLKKLEITIKKLNCTKIA